MTTTTTTSPSLHERLGGPPAVKAAVEEFYKRLLDDEKLAYFFQETNLAALKMHQLQFFKIAFTGIPEDLNVPALLIEKHRRLFQEKGLNATHFDMVAGHFVATLEHLGISQELIDEAVGIVVPLRAAFEKGSEKYGSTEEEKKDESETVATKETLASRLGGTDAVKAAVEGMYTRILADEDLAPFFDNVNMTRLKLHQIEFMKVAFTHIPKGLDVAGLILEKHVKLFQDGLNESHFDKVAGHLIDTLQSLDVSQELVDEVVAVVGPLRPVFEQGALQAKEARVVSRSRELAQSLETLTP